MVPDVIKELENIDNLNASQWVKAFDWLSENPNKFKILKALPVGRKKDYILAFIN